MANFFKQNTGKVDRIIRVIVGALLVGNVFVGLQTVVGWIGLILIVTGLFGTCPVYSLLGINTKTIGEKVGLK
jgi:Inner membrane protein YgaP-like, transmembrane domain